MGVRGRLVGVRENRLVKGEVDKFRGEVNGCQEKGEGRWVQVER